jgi:hypothetical protein
MGMERVRQGCDVDQLVALGPFRGDERQFGANIT